MVMENSKRWKISALPWDDFQSGKVNPVHVKLAKAAALVEYNAGDYAMYLCNVFQDDDDLCEAVRDWSLEERHHGAALAAWSQKADAAFDFQSAFKRYTDGYSINVDARTSIRGSQCGELIARCIVETGTSSYYTALGHATDEPVLKSICAHIAADELRHYAMFAQHLKRYMEKDRLNRLQRLKIGLGRVQESEDDELAFAYFAANAPEDAIYNRPFYTAEYMRYAYPLYRTDNVNRMVGMVFRACGFKLSGTSRRLVVGATEYVLRAKARRAAVRQIRRAA